MQEDSAHAVISMTADLLARTVAARSGTVTPADADDDIYTEVVEATGFDPENPTEQE